MKSSWGDELTTMMIESSDSSLSMVALIFLFRNLIRPLFQSADKSFISLSQKSKLLHLLRWLLYSFFFVLLHLLRALPFSFSFCKRKIIGDDVATVNHIHTGTGGEDSEISRALRQLLSLVNEIPVSSRKYDVVRSLAEKLIHENLKEGSPVLIDVNCSVLLAAFSRTLAQLEAALSDGRRTNWLGFGRGPGSRDYGLVRAVRGWYVEAGPRSEPDEGRISAEKMAAELLWLAEKMEESGGVKVAVEKWAWASNLGMVVLTAEPRVQASLVRLTAFMVKQAKDMERKQETDGEKETKVKMLMTWLPMLCRASNGADAPTLSSREREEMERELEGIVEEIEGEENQEKVLSLWLHHFTQCPHSDWPNLYDSYIRWCRTSRKLLLTRSA